MCARICPAPTCVRSNGVHSMLHAFEYGDASPEAVELGLTTPQPTAFVPGKSPGIVQHGIPGWGHPAARQGNGPVRAEVDASVECACVPLADGRKQLGARIGRIGRMGNRDRMRPCQVEGPVSTVTALASLLAQSQESL